jgi:hypothetical protein
MRGTLSLKAPMSVRAAEEFSRVRLSQSFFMRDFLFSEIAAIERMSNLPDDPKLAIQAGRGLCENLLEPLQATFGRLAIRSAYRSPEVNEFGCRHRLSCASNKRTVPVASGIDAARMAALARWRRSSCPGWSTGWLREQRGRQWLGGFTTTCLTASFNSFRSSLHSILDGTRLRGGQSTASLLRGDFSRNRDSPTMMVTTAICTEASPP